MLRRLTMLCRLPAPQAPAPPPPPTRCSISINDGSSRILRDAAVGRPISVSVVVAVVVAAPLMLNCNLALFAVAVALVVVVPGAWLGGWGRACCSNAVQRQLLLLLLASRGVAAAASSSSSAHCCCCVSHVLTRASRRYLATAIWRPCNVAAPWRGSKAPSDLILFARARRAPHPCCSGVLQCASSSACCLLLPAGHQLHMEQMCSTAKKESLQIGGVSFYCLYDFHCKQWRKRRQWEGEEKERGLIT